jgi:hypothetical protein
MKTRTTLAILDWLGVAFNGIWVCAAIICVYFLYGILAASMPWAELLSPMVIGLIAKQLSSYIGETRHRLNYVDELKERGCVQAEAESAWRTSVDGGTNLLLKLQQSELSQEIEKLEIDIAASSGD